MSQEISGLTSSTKLTSKPKASLEGTSFEPEIKLSPEVQEMNDFEVEMQKITRAFTLVNEIRQTLEEALHKLASSS